MSDRAVWKMLHLLFSGKKKIMSEAELIEAGVICIPDTMEMLKDQDVVEGPDETYKLTKAARAILNQCALANRRWPSEEMRVDYPKAFVIMPFRELWSKGVYEQMIKPAVEAAGLE